jgi:hypothetical protein
VAFTVAAVAPVAVNVDPAFRDIVVPDDCTYVVPAAMSTPAVASASMLLPFRSSTSIAVMAMSDPAPVVEIVVLLTDVDDTVEPFSVSVPVVLPMPVLFPAVLFSVRVAALIVFDVVDVVVVTGAVTVSVDAVMSTVPVVFPIVVLFEPVALMFVVPRTVFVPVELPMLTLPEPVLMFVVAEATLT